MKRLLTVLFAMLSAACAQTAQQSNVRGFEHIHTELAARYYKVGQVAVAVNEAESVLKVSPNYVPAHNLLALMYAQLRQNDKADAHFVSALSLEPTNTDLRNNYAWFLCGSGRSNEALGEFSKVLRDPLYTSMDKALTNAGVCAARIGRMDLAASYLNAALDVSPNNAVAYAYRAHMFISQQSLPAARKDLAQAQANNLGATDLLWLKARLAQASGQTNTAQSAAAELVRIEPTSEAATWARNADFDRF